MTEQELKKLGRGDLMELLLEQGREIERLRAAVETAEQQARQAEQRLSQRELDVEAAVRSGKLTAINRWLEGKIWKYGCMKDPVALFESVCGPFRPEEYVAYLEKKFTEIYEL